MSKFIKQFIHPLGIGFMAMALLLSKANASTHTTERAKQNSQNELMAYFHAAARTSDIEVLEAFLMAGMPIEAKDQKGYTALMIASYNGRLNAVNKLLEYGANACAQDNKGNTALMAAIFKGELKIAQRLLNTHCDTNQQNNAGQTALMYSTLFGRTELTQLLISRGAELTLEDTSGNSAQRIKSQQ